MLPVVREYHRARWALRQLRKPLHRNPPLNGQARRRECIEALLAALRPEEVLETGTFRGSTTLYLAKVQSAPVHSVEMDKYFWLASSLRCLPTRQVRVRFGDSFEFLHERAAGGGGNRLTFFYLDAHGGNGCHSRTRSPSFSERGERRYSASTTSASTTIRAIASTATQGSRCHSTISRLCFLKASRCLPRPRGRRRRPARGRAASTSPWARRQRTG